MEWDHLLGIAEEGQKFQFGCRGHAEFDDLGENGEWAVVGWYGNIFGEKDVVP